MANSLCHPASKAETTMTKKFHTYEKYEIMMLLQESAIGPKWHRFDNFRVSPRTKKEQKLMPRITKRVTEKQKVAWQNFCENQGAKESEMLGMVLEKVTQGYFEADLKGLQKATSSRIRIRLTDEQTNELTVRAKAEGFASRTSWLSSLALSVLGNDPVLSSPEIKALRHSNRQMASIGRNLNQIARVLNIEFRESDKVTLEAIKKLASEIECHREKVSNLASKAMNRWGVK